ncbi:MAG: DUF3303 family protein [Candidatus Zixiibacteriota bacterium]
MKYIIKVTMSMEAGNTALKDPQFGAKMKKLLGEIKAEAAYFTAVDGNRGGYIVVNIDDASQIPAIAEPFFLWLNAELEFMPVMLPQDLKKAGPAIAAAVKNWA